MPVTCSALNSSMPEAPGRGTLVPCGVNGCATEGVRDLCAASGLSGVAPPASVAIQCDLQIGERADCARGVAREPVNPDARAPPSDRNADLLRCTGRFSRSAPTAVFSAEHAPFRRRPGWIPAPRGGLRVRACGLAECGVGPVGEGWETHWVLNYSATQRDRSLHGVALYCVTKEAQPWLSTRGRSRHS
jgi:hypothetical protein